MSEVTNWEDWVLESAAREYRRRGYEVMLHPISSTLPGPIRKLDPDGIAIKKGFASIIFEVVNPSRLSEQRKLDALSAAVKAVPDWTFEVIYAPDAEDVRVLREPTSSHIENEIQNIRALAKSGQRRAAFLLAWAALEAISRSVHAGDDEIWRRPQAPRKMIERLAGNGYITPTEADVLLSLVDARNGIVHGDVDLDVHEDQLEALVKILDNLLAVIGREDRLS